jgi:hypothetical protein
VDLVARVRAAVGRHPAVREVELVGSRARGDPTGLSDWDFLLHTGDVDEVARALPSLVEPLTPLAAQWDRLSEEAMYYMLILPQGVKVDLVLRRRPQVEPPWEVRDDTLAAIDAHFWDWILWLGGKQLRGDRALVDFMLRKLMFDHLLGPLGASAPPATIAEAVDLYRAARGRREREFGITVPRELESTVLPRLRLAMSDEDGADAADA